MTMGQDEQRIRIILDAQDRATQQIRGISRRLTTDLGLLGRNLTLMGGVVSGFSVLAVRAFTQQRVVVANLTSSLDQLGLNFDILKPSIDTVIDSIQKMGGSFSRKELLQAFTVLLDTTKNFDASLRALPAAAALAAGIGKPIAEAADLIAKAMLGDEGAIKALQNLGVELEAGASWTDILTASLKKFTPALEATHDPLKGMKTILADIIDKIIELEKQYPKLTKAVETGSVIVGLAVTAIGGLIWSIKQIAVAGTAAGFILAAFGLEIAAVIVVIAAVVLAIKLLNTDWTKAWENIKDATKAAIDALLGKGTFDALVGAIQNVIDTVKALKDSPWETIKTLAKGLIVAFIGPGGFDAIAGAVKNVIDTVKALKDSPWEGIKNLAKILIDFLIGPEAFAAVVKSIDAVKDALEFLRAKMQSLSLSSVWEAVKNAGKNTFQAIIDTIKLMIELWNKIPFLPNIPLPATSSPTPAPEPIEVFQHGGLVTKPTLGLLGEAGPEMVVPLSRMNGGLAGGQTAIININFHGPVYGMRDFEDRIREIVRTTALYGGFRFVFEQ